MKILLERFDDALAYVSDMAWDKDDIADLAEVQAVLFCLEYEP